MSELKVDPTPMELGERDRERFERLDRMAERGEIRPSGRARRRSASAGPISAEEFEATMALDRPRATGDLDARAKA